MKPIYILAALGLGACVPVHQPPCERLWEVYVAGACQPQREDRDAAPDRPTAPETTQPEPDDDDDRDDDRYDRGRDKDQDDDDDDDD